MSTIMATSTTLVTLMMLVTPFAHLHTPYFHEHVKDAVKTAFALSLIPLMLFLRETPGDTTINWHWSNLGPLNLALSFNFDMYPIIFLPVAFLVTWSILDFSIWYMSADQKINTFFAYLLLFLVAMILLVTTNSLYVMFIGWEGVGIMSFLLIGWYHARSNAATAAAQAVLYNRLGDIGFVMAMSWLMLNSSSPEITHILLTKPPTLILIAFIVAAASKSAQFTLHPWLASAMEGPTPVSALLHSSTMVVAGVYLLIRIHPLLAQNQTALTTCLCLGAISTAFAATCALTQNDIKKIIAYSTASQLGLMMVAIGLNFPNLAFFHICTHAFFKAMLFLCSGLIIHNLNDEQDIRKMGGLRQAMPMTAACMSIGSLALMGTPFLAGFFSKDAIIEAINTSNVNLIALMLVLIATTFTAVYSCRLIALVLLNYPQHLPTCAFDENTPTTMYPLIRLATGSVIAGLLILQYITPDHQTTHTMPTHIKLIALLITIIAFIAALMLADTHWRRPPLMVEEDLDPTSTYEQVTHRAVTDTITSLAWTIITHKIEKILLKKLMPELLRKPLIQQIKKTQLTQAGMIQLYLAAFYITLLLSLTILAIL